MISIDFIAAHMLGDYIVQSLFPGMATQKLTNHKVRAVHVTTYVMGFVPFLYLLQLPLPNCVCFCVLNWASHFITDSRRWASGDDWPPLPIMVDQSIHAVTLALLSHFCFG